MKSDFVLSLDDIKSRNENALELFYSGIKSEQTRRSMEGNLKRFLVVAGAEIFSGDFKKRVQEFVDLSKEDQDKATSIVLAYVRKLRERASFDKNDPNYLNPSSIPNKIKPIRKLLDRQDASLSYAKNLLWMIFVSSRGGQNRIRIISALRKSPFNANQLTKELGLNYRAIQHHIDVLEKNNLVTHVGEKYGMAYFPSTLLEVNMIVFDEIVANLSNLKNKN